MSEDKEDTLTHVNGAEVTSISEPDEKTGKRQVSCKDGKQYVWHKDGAVYPLGHPHA